MQQTNDTTTTLYSLVLTEAKYLVNSGKINPEPAKHIIFLRSELKAKLRESNKAKHQDPDLEAACKTALEELQKAIKEVAPHGWDFDREQQELYKRLRGDKFMASSRLEGIDVQPPNPDETLEDVIARHQQEEK
jgi:hypothetical protein